MGCNNVKEEILLEHSKILKTMEDKEKLKKLFTSEENKVIDFKLLFQARKDCPQNFHLKCNKKAPIVILVKVRETEEIFGIFLSIELESPTKYTEFKRTDKNCFLFSLTSMQKYQIKNKDNFLIQIFPEDDPNFISFGEDIILNKKFLEKKLNSAILHKENIKDGGDYDVNLAKTINNDQFTVEELEVIYVIFLLREKNEYYIE